MTNGSKNESDAADHSPRPATAAIQRIDTSALLKFYAAVLILELIASYALPRYPMEIAKFLTPFVNAVSTVAPVVHNFDRLGRNVVALNVFFTVTLCLVPMKSALIYKWLHVNPQINASYFVITPLTRARAGGFHDFATAKPVIESGEDLRGPIGRYFWSILELLIAAATVTVMLNWGFNISKAALPNVSVGFGSMALDVVQMGLSIWIPWSLLLTSLCALTLAISAAVLRDTARVRHQRAQVLDSYRLSLQLATTAGSFARQVRAS